MRTLSTAALSLAAGLALVACGGGDDIGTIESPPPPPPVITAVPDSAVASSTALVSYLNGLSMTDESGEALTLPTVEASSSETEEPVAI